MFHLVSRCQKYNGSTLRALNVLLRSMLLLDNANTH